MIPRTSILVLADDLTGAAEIAAAAYSHGLTASIATGSVSGQVSGDVVVHDTDTRLLQPPDAARKIVSVGARCQISDAMQEDILVFKKTDSVLRGPIVAELDTLAAISRHSRVLLVAGNPNLDRVIREGQLYVGGEAIHRTIFARDPHHPAHSALVTDLLGPPRRGAIHVIKPDEDLPVSGLIVGEVSTMDDVHRWAHRIVPDMLPAGSSVFFEAILEARGSARITTPPVALAHDQVLLVSGTTAGTTRAMLQSLPAGTMPVHQLPETCALTSAADAASAINLWTAGILSDLARRGRAVALAPDLPLNDPAAPGRIRAAFATMIAELHTARAFRHLIIEGGATAATIVHRLHWNVLGVSGEPARGIATLIPGTDPEFDVTLKPGSYPWPESWVRALASTATDHPPA